MTYDAVLTRMRRFGAALPEYSEGSHSGAVAFKSSGRMFGTLRAVGEGDGQLVVGLEPEHATMLIDGDARFERYPRAPHTVVLRVSRFEWKEIEPLVRESHALATAPSARSTRKRPRRPPPAPFRAPDGEQLRNAGGADEAGSTCDEDAHGNSP
jgi:hypothetical protein